MTAVIYASGATGYDALFAHVTQAFIHALLNAAQVSAGHRILDVATGTGAAAREAAKLVGPTGEIIAGDISSTMLEVARSNPENTAIKFEQFDGHALPFPSSRFDRVICQLGLSFLEDPARGLREFWRVLAPGGRTAVIVNSTPERSLYARIGTVVGKYVPEMAEQLDRYASIRTLERLRSLLEGAGFTEVEVHAQTRTFSFASFDDYFSGPEAGSGLSGQEYLKLSADLRALVREDVRRSFPNNGNARPFVVEMEVLVGAGRK
jgi:ubiquinone/menaquinone biosynthesis C-methylase UbiE